MSDARFSVQETLIDSSETIKIRSHRAAPTVNRSLPRISVPFPESIIASFRCDDKRRYINLLLSAFSLQPLDRKRFGEESTMGFFQRLKEGLFKTKSGLADKVEELAQNTRVIDDDFYDELTDILILADVGVPATGEIIEKLKAQVKEKKIKDGNQAKEVFKQIIIDEMNIPRPLLKWPMVMFVVGVNGVGKTTTIGKLALRFQEIGRSVMLAAADTFRAAADEQLAIWADRAQVPIVRGREGGDPAAVVYDAVQSAKAHKTDLLIVDTAGRLHNKKNLMDELGKMRRIIDREYPEAEMRCMLVLDATTGQNGIQQAKQFKEAAEINGIVLTKLDGTAKGGVAIAIRKELNIPVWYIGVGEGIDDLQSFDAKEFVSALFGDKESKA